MKLFKLIASKAGKVVFDDRIEAENPRTAREQMKSLLGLQSLTGVVYSITEIPVELIREIVATKVLEVIGSRRSGCSSIDVSKIVGDAANVAVADRLRPIEQRLAALEGRQTAASTNGTHSPSSRRFDAFQRDSTRSREADTPATNGRSAEPETPLPAMTDWRAVKRFYKHCRSPKQTAAHFDLSINTVKARVRREGW
ncbi:hypothetical protein CfE428DRAFT_1331 [Chthoniobacter flavus Ellin428]|uniref:Uncharacterized protein n=1 Tax=Chthoniobacter flavus Ellin428 TaxID=497964 RepID=B4CXP0_9BACT|nr:hypothetical protein [Chthoniobacter flavus]EDY21038.1 hypothetical protein CfE428DRAFT_1331 [Chthoniobacter flavus Ellin428]TCO88763.1 hypothetical protein EV701_116135 [Chthoniobacter flavus]